MTVVLKTVTGKSITMVNGMKIVSVVMVLILTLPMTIHMKELKQLKLNLLMRTIQRICWILMVMMKWTMWMSLLICLERHMQTAMRIIQRCWTSHLQTMIGILWTMVKRTIVVMQATRIIMTMMATKARIVMSHRTHTTRTMTAMGMTTRSLQMDIMTR